MDRSIYDSDLDWWFGCHESLLGERGSTSSTISALERGNAVSGTYEEPWGHLKLWDWHEQMERERTIRARLLLLTKDQQILLEAHYSTLAQRIPHVSAKFGELANAMVFLAKSLDLLSAKLGELEELQNQAQRELKAAPKAWRATRPRRVSYGFESGLQVSLPHAS